METGNMSLEEKKALAAKLQQEIQADDRNRRAAYESLRKDFMTDVWNHLIPVVDNVSAFRVKLSGDGKAFHDTMGDYGKLRRGDMQTSFTVTEAGFEMEVKNDRGEFTKMAGDFRLEVKSNREKSFDERADLAAERLINYLKEYVGRTEKGTEDAMYQLAMTLLERNKQGDLDYKSISKLYALESRFDGEYSEIMQLFKESNVVYKTATNYYFYWRNPENGVWKRIEPSFCRL